ncbi:hypothetical protein [Spirosoma foliorum]|uniref:Uncharacterized protein n=1 Tax=Spirosoma foliorum TaxID=2710596 RepID=A0A7G5H2V2_9BACT|nr:hypothetical protein [Spirosoma foliorum]QMW05444.1 hypothetical protein H3H32_11405 [Spirosoma foliorum]
MKTFNLFVLGFMVLGLLNQAIAQYASCPNSGTDVTGHLAMRLRNPTTGVLYTGAPQANTVYQLEIYETPYSVVPPNYVHYENIGIMGVADGFKLYQSASTAQNSPNDYYSAAAISSGVGPDVGASGGVAVFGIKTLDASDPDWSGQLSAIKAYGECTSSIAGYPAKYYKKVLAIVP